jgi:hypothetical protein
MNSGPSQILSSVWTTKRKHAADNELAIILALPSSGVKPKKSLETIGV